MMGARTLLLTSLCAWFPLCVLALFGCPHHRPITGVRQGNAAFLRHVSRLRAGGDTEREYTDHDDDEHEMNPIIIFDPDEHQDNDDDSSEKQQLPRRAIILMDSFCDYHGLYLASRAQEQVPGTAIIPVLSDYLFDFVMQTQPERAAQHRRMRLPQTPDQVAAWRRKLPDDLELVAVYCESDSGLANAEALRAVLNVTCRDKPDQLPARRNKYLMQEGIRKVTDLAIVQQQLCATVQEAQDFANQLFNDGHEYVVVKPYRGVASEAVQLCRNATAVQLAFEAILGSAVFGSRDRHESVLVQEFLYGQEYALDIVSCNGQHKIAAVWRYDKRPANGAPFCYFHTRLVDATVDPAVEAICEYMQATLTALGVRYGLSHNEVIVTADRGPVLVEVNCRQHNMDFLPLTMACVGYNALDMTLVAMLGDPSEWERFPDMPVLRAHGMMTHLVNFAQGRLKVAHHLDEMSSLASFLDGEVYEQFLTPGSDIKPTIDIRTDSGWVQLVNEDEEELIQDYLQIVDWMPTMFEVDD